MAILQILSNWESEPLMTGMPFRKIRHYTDAVEKGAPPRPDFNVRGVAFKNINAILSKQTS